MDAHVLNGDALKEKFKLEGQVIVARECLMEGPVKASSQEEFWKMRAGYLAESFKEVELLYFDEVKSEFEKLKDLKNISAINLWFDHDLFCQVNMWFIINFLADNNIQLPVFRVMPPPIMFNVWSGFGNMKSHELQLCYDNRVKFFYEDIQLSLALWDAYCEGDNKTLRKLSPEFSPCYPLLLDAVEAHLDRFPLNNGRPQKRLKEIMTSGVTDFNDIFKEFSKTEGVYGFGDVQIKHMLAMMP